MSEQFEMAEWLQFTREELQVTLDSIEFDMHTYKPSDNGFNHNLVAKLRLMIDYRTPRGRKSQ